jgi:hypothetical protein
MSVDQERRGGSGFSGLRWETFGHREYAGDALNAKSSLWPRLPSESSRILVVVVAIVIVVALARIDHKSVRICERDGLASGAFSPTATESRQ